MRSLLQLWLILVIIGVLHGCASNPPSNPDNVCSIFAEKRGWHKAARKAEAKWGTPVNVPMAIMYQESAFRRKARPPRRRLLGFIPWRRPSSAFGYAQAVNGTWREYMNATGQYWRVRHDFADAFDFVNWYIREAGRRNGISRDDAFNLYMNYHEGPAGFARGTHKSKPWLQKVATGVQLRSQRYATQYAGCRKDLMPGWWARLWGW